LEKSMNVRKDHRSLILLGFAILLAYYLFCPFIPESHTNIVIRPLQYDSSLGENIAMGSEVSPQTMIQVTVTNNDITDGNFSVTLNLWKQTSQPYQLLSNSFQTKTIGAGSSQVFNVPSNWMSNGQYSYTRNYAFNDQYLINYSVTAPSASVNSTQTEWKSIFTRVFS